MGGGLWEGGLQERAQSEIRKIDDLMEVRRQVGRLDEASGRLMVKAGMRSGPTAGRADAQLCTSRRDKRSRPPHPLYPEARQRDAFFFRRCTGCKQIEKKCIN